MKIKVAVVCQQCKKQDAAVIAAPVGVDKTDQKYHWKLCSACSQEKTKYGSCWQIIGEYKPIIKEINQ